MNTLSNTEILESILGDGYVQSQVFLAEQIIKNHIGAIPENWDDTLSLVTAEIVKRLNTFDTGVKSESVEGHSVTYKDAKSIRDIIGPGLLSILDSYTIVPTTDGLSGSFNMI